MPNIEESRNANNQSIKVSTADQSLDKLSNFVKGIVTKDNFEQLPNDNGYKILKMTLEEGNGPFLQLNQHVEIGYAILRRNGTVLESNLTESDVLPITVGDNKFLPCITSLLQSMKLYERALYLCDLESQKSHLFKESPAFPTGEDTVIYIVVHSVDKGEDISIKQNRCIIKHTIIKGVDNLTIENMDTFVTVELIGFVKDQIFDKRIESFVLCEARERNIVNGVVLAIKNLTLGEKAKFYIKSSQAYGKYGYKPFNIQPKQDIVYEITLLNFVDVQHEEMESLMATAISNAAQCSLNLELNYEAIDECKQSLSVRKNDEKTLFRLGTAYYRLKSFKEAVEQFNSVLLINGNNKIAASYRLRSEKELKGQLKAEKEKYMRVFNKMSAPKDEHNKDFPSVDDFNVESVKGMVPLDEEQRMFDHDPK
ncbi:DgyrCDS9551 [Dimorphilus gyrociliatus]|uniref:peptidylprolyl isomerase n=1 Tax=Dimorphilus gyrociliatus TaxID=2664684 RepID=A0A7I8VYM5_9ANNE|nr:DgyrCDS9551 [Dimorphilus gyrociliatus]